MFLTLKTSSCICRRTLNGPHGGVPAVWGGGSVVIDVLRRAVTLVRPVPTVSGVRHVSRTRAIRIALIVGCHIAVHMALLEKQNIDFLLAFYMIIDTQLCLMLYTVHK